MGELSHFDAQGRGRMVDVSGKDSTVREAIAHGVIDMELATLERIREGRIKKGDVLAVADVAAVMAAKRTPDLIPMCHPIALSGVEINFEDFEVDGRGVIDVKVTVRCEGPTGVEMEALTAVSAALLTIYDMCKAIDRGMRMKSVELLRKSGGKSGLWQREDSSK
ncbi:MAG: cyclic pyranopterin monophosphate synthase MoaC [Proteobacteria bacterium]|nr:cyclic pyranopterin monophosphate synthase MoaC [Pseudomonadota bacterium]